MKCRAEATQWPLLMAMASGACGGTAARSFPSRGASWRCRHGLPGQWCMWGHCRAQRHRQRRWRRRQRPATVAHRPLLQRVGGGGDGGGGGGDGGDDEFAMLEEAA